MTVEIAIIVSLLVWVGIFAGWWLRQMLLIDKEPKTPKGWKIIRPRRRFHQWFQDYPYDKFDSPSPTRFPK
ncbi:hypothetical protein [Sulfobacillus thermosulfidooxidans]|uniref:Uncharacterized protein n=2 Tax=Sulfobacillus thermosulfidooxidans TaxID=28034 RepID=A0A1W1WJD7_SULTA|nr:hypothetical protein [Sulfobacillus thermosulfidooxidans]OLZ12182.1 hypothetical protein BFX05_00250 [Sulfobacillus thermosulfidooxidans]OLZ13038.1 hypothetical protein BFX06_10805 [Sulfobacillus thermosulfidooxidans]OLZ21418.1 hypothetical protein BFX07_11230 [Sulfobacillus thermosulfidooxidans]PSR27488.1 MAG: hypothetical protein C7B47_07960 [Sulfobacillus thermosulfidooxidans]SMC06387.1 hypothetical protein SAMN00768000_2794 [Sulfobacillus thermosulfidooxidans DSM 9293]